MLIENCNEKLKNKQRIVDGYYEAKVLYIDDFGKKTICVRYRLDHGEEYTNDGQVHCKYNLNKPSGERALIRMVRNLTGDYHADTVNTDDIVGLRVLLYISSVERNNRSYLDVRCLRSIQSPFDDAESFDRIAARDDEFEPCVKDSDLFEHEGCESAIMEEDQVNTQNQTGRPFLGIGASWSEVLTKSLARNNAVVHQ